MTETTATRSEIASYILAGAALVFIVELHLVPALLAGFLAHALLSHPARRFRGLRLSHGAAKVAAAGVMAVIAASAVTGLVLLLHAFWRGHVGNLPELFRKMADALETTRDALEKRGLGALLPGLDLSIPIEERMTAWLREHGGQIRHAGAAGGRLILRALVGIVIGILVFFEPGAPADRPLSKALCARVSRFSEAFESVLFAQAEISGINTAMTALYLLGVLPLFGIHLPFRETLIAVTFLAGLVPIVGNLASNTVIVVVSLGVGPWVAVGSLAFLVVIHKLEYFFNAKIVGGRIGASAWEILLAIVVAEVAFGIVGVVLAPIVYAYAKRELTERHLV